MYERPSLTDGVAPRAALGVRREGAVGLCPPRMVTSAERPYVAFMAANLAGRAHG